MLTGAIRPPARNATLYSKGSGSTSHRLRPASRRSLRVPAIAALGGLAIVLAGCVPSLQPLYTAEDVAFEPALVGTWAGSDGGDTWTFQKGDGAAYRLFIAGAKVPDRFEVHLVSLADQRFLDIYPIEPENAGSEFYRGHLIPAHSFARISLDRDTLQVASLNHSWLWGMISGKKLRIAHEVVGSERIVLTAPTKDLQAFMKKYAGNQEAFQPMEFHRQK